MANFRVLVLKQQTELLHAERRTCLAAEIFYPIGIKEYNISLRQPRSPELFVTCVMDLGAYQYLRFSYIFCIFSLLETTLNPNVF